MAPRSYPAAAPVRREPSRFAGRLRSSRAITNSAGISFGFSSRWGRHTILYFEPPARSPLPHEHGPATAAVIAEGGPKRPIEYSKMNSTDLSDRVPLPTRHRRCTLLHVFRPTRS